MNADTPPRAAQPEPAAPTVVEPEPVAWLHQHTGYLSRNESQRSEKDLRAYDWSPLYLATPPRATLSDTEIEALRADAMRYRWLLEKSGFGIRRNGVHELSFAFYIQQPDHINELSACIDAELQASGKAVTP